MYGNNQEIKDGQITNKPEQKNKRASIRENIENSIDERTIRKSVERLVVPPLVL